jgi:flagellar protein FliO/FliZ
MMRLRFIALPGLLAANTAFAAPGVGMADLSAVIMSLALVIAFIFAAAWAVRRMPFGVGRGNGPLKVLAALPLGQKERLVLVEARGEEILLAVSPAGVFNVGVTRTHAAGNVRPPSPEPTFVLPDPS